MKKKNTPILVSDTEWPLPNIVVREIKAERMINSLLDVAKLDTLSQEDLVGWAEVVGYLMPITQKVPVSNDIADIYLYCVRRMLERMKRYIPKEIKNIELSDYQKKKLKDLKEWIYKKRGGKEVNPIINALKEAFTGRHFLKRKIR